MVGPWPLAPHQDYVQYVYHVFLMQAGLKPGYYNRHYQKHKYIFTIRRACQGYKATLLCRASLKQNPEYISPNPKELNPKKNPIR